MFPSFRLFDYFTLIHRSLYWSTDMCTLDAERISVRQLIHIPVNAYIRVYVVSRFRKVIIVTLNFLGVMFKNGNFHKYDDQAREALMRMCIPSYSD